MSSGSFELIRTQKIDSLNVLVEEYRHSLTGAMHYHLASDNDENVFLVAVRTMPTDSSGVAHILEHTALCGSKKYPVRDPFFMMIRRSLNTFMNAFTSSDWTAYPFASKNKKDFNNLLDVYLDAVFFANLDEMDFEQEGHRLEFAETGDMESDLEFKGVVYNEMKGAMSSVTSQLWQTLTKYVYPTNTYHFNSGGDPESILKLGYEQLRAFYEEHYHPSNAIFMTYGDIPASEHHTKILAYVDQFSPLQHKIIVEDETRYHAPVRVEEFYSASKLEKQTHFTMGWLLGHSSNLDEQLEAHFLSSILLENSSSPLRHALETSDYGTGPSPLCGLEDSNKEMCFVCGIEGADEADRDNVENLIINTLKSVADNGVSTTQIESVLHQLELSQREVGGDGYPYGLQIMLSAISACTHYSDPIGLLDLDPAIDRLREKARDREFIKSLINKYLLNNSHRVTLTFKPDLNLDERKNKSEKQLLEKIKSSLSNDQKQEIVDRGLKLKARQQQEDDDSILPRVTLNDVAEHLNVPVGDISNLASESKLTTYEQGTNGLTYFQVIMSLPLLNQREIELLPLLTNYLTEIGVGEEDYLTVQQKQSLIVGGISAYSSIRADINDLDKTKGYWVVSGKALGRNHEAFFDLVLNTINKATFTEHDRIQDLLSQTLNRKEQSITGNGHGLAMSAASSGISSIAQYSYQSSGLPSLLRMRTLVDQSKDEEKLAALCLELKQLHQKIIQSKPEYLLISDGHNLQNAIDCLELKTKTETETKHVESAFTLPTISQTVKEAWVISSQANFCSMAFKTVGAGHKDSPALAVLGVYLKNGFLHTAIREQGGAYGGGASQDSAVGAFKFYSYRDPRVKGTFADFERCIDWFNDNNADEELLEQSILGVVSSIDKPNSPAGEAKQAFHNEMQGRSAKWRNDFRLAILSITPADLQRVVKRYLVNAQPSMAALVQKERVNEAKELGMDIKEL